jgi:hypothetical protein
MKPHEQAKPNPRITPAKWRALDKFLASRAEPLGPVHVRVRAKDEIFLCTSKNGQLDCAQTLGAQTCHRYTSAVSSSP